MIEIISTIVSYFQYGIIQKAFISGVLLAITSSLLGVFLVMRRYALISDGLAHVSFASVAIALAAGISPLFFSIPLVVCASILISTMTRRINIHSDSAIGLVSAASVALGIVVISLTKGVNLDIFSYLFGSILAITSTEVILSAVISVIVIGILILFFNELFLITYDEEYAKISGLKIRTIDLILTIVQSVAIVIGVKIVGAMLMSSLIIFPAVSALQIARSFRLMIIFSITVSTISMITGILTSFILNTPTGATVVLVNAAVFIVILLINKIFRIK